MRPVLSGRDATQGPEITRHERRTKALPVVIGAGCDAHLLAGDLVDKAMLVG
jgi:hypothetical protein